MGLLDDKGRARLFYRFLSKVYDRVNPFIWTEEMRSQAIDMLSLSPDDRVLDVGCGTGFGTEGLLESVEEVHAIDQSVHQLERARAKLGERGTVRFLLGDAERLPFRDDAFDVIWSSGSIEYWPNPVGALAEFGRVGRPGGAVLVVGPNAPKTAVMRRLADAIMLFYDETEADRMFTEAGLVDVEHRIMGPSYDPDIAIATRARIPENSSE